MSAASEHEGGGLAVHPFSLPLSESELAAALRNGRGRAWLHVREYGGAAAAHVLVELLTHGHRYDNQCESDRSEWLLEIVAMLEDVQDVHTRIVASLQRPIDSDRDDWEKAHDLRQRIRTAFALAKRGVSGAREALYALLHREGFDWFGAEEIIELDGEAGFLEVARRLGVSPVPGGVGVGELRVLEHYESVHGDGAGLELLRRNAGDPKIAAFLFAVEFREGEEAMERDESPLQERRQTSVDTILTWIQEERHRYAGPYLGWGERATPEELERVYEAMVADEAPTVGRLAAYAAVFARVEFPKVAPVLLRLAQHEDAEVRARAHWGLAKHADVRVRELALRRLAEGVLSGRALHLFARNWRAGDAERIGSVLRPVSDSDEMHTLGSDLLDVLAVAKPAHAGELLAFVYEYTPCAICRCESVELATELGCASGWMIVEARQDGDEYVRAAACRNGGGLKSGGSDA